MTLRIRKFLGSAPRLAPELLPDTAAQVAHNVRLESGDLIPFRLPRVVAPTGRAGHTVRTLFGLRNPTNLDDVRWLSWTTDVDVVLQPDFGEVTPGHRGRFYYTGDGVPKVSTFDMATSGALPFPTQFYELGLPLPVVRPTGVPVAFVVSNTTHFARDTANTATLTTSAAHSFRSGNIISVTGFTGDPARTFNATNAEVTVLSPTQVTYFSPGNEVSSTANTAGRVSLAGRIGPRGYVYTWMTPWGEESIPSEASVDAFVREGQTVTVSSLPSGPPAGGTFTRGIRLYRSVSTPGGSAWLRLHTLWFPVSLAQVSRASNVSTVSTLHPHNLLVGERLRISGAAQTTFNGDWTVTVVVNRTTFRFAQVAADVALTTETAGTLFMDAAPNTTVAARFWGVGGVFTFTDDFDVRLLSRPLTSQDSDPPPPDLRGLVMAHNNVFAGFVGNRVFFSEPGRPHAWPRRFASVLESPVVALVAASGFIIALTQTHIYRISGTDPSVMVPAKIDVSLPCLSKRSAVNMGYGVVYSTHGGLAVYNASTGADIITRQVHGWHSWGLSLVPSSILAAQYRGQYFAAHSTGGLLFERDDRIGGFLVTTQQQFDSTWVDERTNILYFTHGTSGDVSEWDSPLREFFPVEWKSKVLVSPDYGNLGAARVLADFTVSKADVDAWNAQRTAVINANNAAWAANLPLGTLNADLVNTVLVNGDSHLQSLPPPLVSFPVLFRLWANRQLVFSADVFTTDIFRLPAGYKTDIYEVGVSGSARVRAVHLAQTPLGLQKV